MSKKEIITALIQIYKQCITECKKVSTHQEMLDICYDRNCLRGICDCSRMRLGIRIHTFEWVVEKCYYKSYSSKYWAVPVDETENIPDLISSLEKRLNILEAELSIS